MIEEAYHRELISQLARLALIFLGAQTTVVACAVFEAYENKATELQP